MTGLAAPLQSRTLGIDATIVEVRDETADARTITFEWAGHEGYRPGQFVTLRIPSVRTGFVARSYSLSTSPGVDPRPAITVKRTHEGYGSNWLCDNAAAGMTIHLLPPSGVFTPHGWDHDLHLFAAGSGITPVLSIIKAALAEHDGRVTLFYANRDVESVIFRELLDDLALRYPDRLRVEHWLEDESGLPTADAVARHCTIPAGDEAFVCGPSPFMDLVEGTLTAAGVDHRHVHIERYVSLTGDPFTLDTGQNSNTAESATVVVQLDGTTHTVECARTTRILDALLTTEVVAPYSCREGDCGSCVARLVSGEVNRGAGTALEPEDEADGYLLTCQATPAGDNIEIEFD
ncbi:ferredoxin--NADP reductase [Aldersonia sp. NBC_00410]|uniref:ferredoxin--NADP reductase n=1 Tax=Aldersonia sp. NBC_00410 TaxID=2975954 RepID=UPI0022553769|nr:ferredoxin--NADP reductase [Aldersonia sp. NBC_00410]MCX5046371.1 ferredoxin--NADP reductase [Aldersonia sp. NBC_00410]